LGHVEVTTNGTRKVTDAEQPENVHEAPRPLNGQSMDERLDALMETIRTWDWRAAPVEAGPPPANRTASTVSALTATAPAEHREQPAVVHGEPAVVSEQPGVVLEQPAVASDSSVVVRDEPAVVSEQPGVPSNPSVMVPEQPAVFLEQLAVVPEQPAVVREDSEPLTHDPSPVWGAQETQPVVIEPLPPQVTAEPSVPEKPEIAIDGASSSPAPRHRHRAKARPAPIRRLWSHRWTKMAVLCLAAVVAVFLIISGIRLVNKNPNLVPPSTTVTTATSHVHHTAFVAPISAAQLAQYEQYAQGLQKANAVATKGFVSAGSTPTTTQLTVVATPYRSSLNLYDFQLNFIQWPASMQTAIELDHTQLKALMSFLPSISSVSPTGISAWLSQLHSRTGLAQTADNQVREDLGLPISTSFP